MGVWIITGGRYYNDRAKVFRGLDHVHEEYGISLLVEGKGGKTDEFGRLWAISRRVPFESVPADWDDIEVEGALVREHPDGKLYNAAAGPMRNQKMIDDFEPEGLIHFPGNRGTNDMIERAAKAGLEVINGVTLE